MIHLCHSVHINHITFDAKQVITEQVEREQLEHLREYFRQCVTYYREVSKQLPHGSDLAYQRMAESNDKK
ncbi:DNA polymerase III subunit theta [Brenneria alni]|uniref:DNA polymerase III subunit theta n=1 Tax=Brenneria alni TaxID=71656 RepID=UPI000EF1B3BD